MNANKLIDSYFNPNEEQFTDPNELYKLLIYSHYVLHIVRIIHRLLFPWGSLNSLHPSLNHNLDLNINQISQEVFILVGNCNIQEILKKSSETFMNQK